MTSPRPTTAALALLIFGSAAAVLIPWRVAVVPPAFSVEFVPAGSGDADAITRTPAVKYAVVSFATQAGRTYRVQRRDEISDWTDIETAQGNGQPSRLLFMLCADDSVNQWRVTE